MRIFPLIVIIGLTLLVATGSATEYSVTDDLSVEYTVSQDRFDSFHIMLQRSDRLEFSVNVVSGSEIDVYMFDPSQYSDYKNPYSTKVGFMSRWEKDKTVSSSYGPITSDTDFYIVVDNADISQSGAMSTGPVTYAVTIRFIHPTAFGLFLPPLEVYLSSLVLGAILSSIYVGYTVHAERSRSPVPGICPKCGEITNYNSHVRQYHCPKCNVLYPYQSTL